MKKGIVIGLDIGGTKIATGAVDTRGELLEEVVLPTRAREGIKVSMGQIYRSVEDLMEIGDFPKKEIVGIGVSAAGPLDPESGILINPPNLKGWRRVPLRERIEDRFGLPTRVENDANAAGFAEMIWGAARGHRTALYVTVSTGIGMGILIDGKIYHGAHGLAGEGGHVVVNYDEREARCGCGRRGCIEAIASGSAVERRVRKMLRENAEIQTRIRDLVGGKLGKITMKTVEAAARQGDSFAGGVIRRMAQVLGAWLGGMINLFDPEIIVVGGGVSMIGRSLFGEMRRSVLQWSINIHAKSIPIVPAQLRRAVGIYGGAALFMA